MAKNKGAARAARSLEQSRGASVAKQQRLITTFTPVMMTSLAYNFESSIPYI